jgi:magnesium-transporting ATPase (P-type)
MQAPVPSQTEQIPVPERTQGLTSEEAAQLLEQHGPNELTPQKRTSIFGLIFQFLNPLSLILLGAAAISAVIGERLDAALIARIVLIGSGIDFYQSHKVE